MSTSGFDDKATGEAFQWLTKPGTIQVSMLESAMRNYRDPVYDPSDVAKHLARALGAPMADFKGDVSKVQMIVLAVATIGHASSMGWDVAPSGLKS